MLFRFISVLLLLSVVTAYPTIFGSKNKAKVQSEAATFASCRFKELSVEGKTAIWASFRTKQGGRWMETKAIDGAAKLINKKYIDSKKGESAIRHSYEPPHPSELRIILNPWTQEKEDWINTQLKTAMKKLAYKDAEIKVLCANPRPPPGTYGGIAINVYGPDGDKSTEAAKPVTSGSILDNTSNAIAASDKKDKGATAGWEKQDTKGNAR